MHHRGQHPQWGCWPRRIPHPNFITVLSIMTMMIMWGKKHLVRSETSSLENPLEGASQQLVWHQVLQVVWGQKPGEKYLLKLPGSLWGRQGRECGRPPQRQRGRWLRRSKDEPGNRKESPHDWLFKAVQTWVIRWPTILILERWNPTSLQLVEMFCGYRALPLCCRLSVGSLGTLCTHCTDSGPGKRFKGYIFSTKEILNQLLLKSLINDQRNKLSAQSVPSSTVLHFYLKSWFQTNDDLLCFLCLAPATVCCGLFSVFLFLILLKKCVNVCREKLLQHNT